MSQSASAKIPLRPQYLYTLLRIVLYLPFNVRIVVIESMTSLPKKDSRLCGSKVATPTTLSNLTRIDRCSRLGCG